MKSTPAQIQSRRRLKYGANVLLSSLLAISVAVFVIWIAQARSLHLFNHDFSVETRADLTADASNTLGPRTIAVLRDLPGRITLVDLCPQLSQQRDGREIDTRQSVENILARFREQNPRQISTVAIDPVAEPGKLDQWLAQLRAAYGGSTDQFDAVLRSGHLQKLAASLGEESAALSALVGDEAIKPLPAAQATALRNNLAPAIAMLQNFAQTARSADVAIAAELERRLPDYYACRDQDAMTLEQVASGIGRLIEVMGKLRDDTAAPTPARQSGERAIQTLGALKTSAEADLDRARRLQKIDVKLDPIRGALTPRDQSSSAAPAIAVLGPDNVRVLDLQSIWFSDGNTNSPAGASTRVRFAAEQQIASAILSLSHPPKTLAVVWEAQSDKDRDVTAISDIVERLRGDNFKVVVKDLSGNYAKLIAAARKRGITFPDEPSDEELRDAIWIAYQGWGQAQIAAPPSILAERVRQHLAPQPVGGDLTSDAKNPAIVRSASHAFAPADKGRALEVFTASGWTAGVYPIDDVQGGAAVLHAAPAAAGAGGGVWEELQGTDLHRVAGDGFIVASAVKKFNAADKGDVLRIRGLSGWKAGNYKVIDVKNDMAILDADPASAPTAANGAWDIAPGAALCLAGLANDGFARALSMYGVAIDSQAILVHESIKTGSQADDLIEALRRSPTNFVLHDLGDHPVARESRGLEAVLSAGMPVGLTQSPPAGARVDFIIPIPNEPPSWGETNLSFLKEGAAPPALHDGDIVAGPGGAKSRTAAPAELFAGAAGERPGAGRFVVIGARDWASNSVLRLTNPAMSKQRLAVSQFPGNSQLFIDSVLWLAGEESMIALSPSTLDTPRLFISEPAARFWRVAVFMVGMPASVILAGLMVFWSRRDRSPA